MKKVLLPLIILSLLQTGCSGDRYFISARAATNEEIEKFFTNVNDKKAFIPDGWYSLHGEHRYRTGNSENVLSTIDFSFNIISGDKKKSIQRSKSNYSYDFSQFYCTMKKYINGNLFNETFHFLKDDIYSLTKTAINERGVKFVKKPESLWLYIRQFDYSNYFLDSGIFDVDDKNAPSVYIKNNSVCARYENNFYNYKYLFEYSDDFKILNNYQSDYKSSTDTISIKMSSIDSFEVYFPTEIGELSNEMPFLIWAL